MKKAIFIEAVIIMLLFGNFAHAGVSLVKNGSFENDGQISPITTENTPQYWPDVNIPSKFVGYVDTDWSTHSYDDGDGNCLTLYSKATEKYNYGEKAMISQQVYLTDVNQIIFDLKLSSSDGTWRADRRSAIVFIDGNDIWDSNNWAPDANGEYRNQRVDINDVNGIGDGKLHTLSLAIVSNVTETSLPSFVRYRVHWDFVKFNAHCGGFGYLPEDLDHSCYVDMNDLEILAERWLAEDPNWKYDLFQDDENIVNFHDFAVLADGWLDNTYWQNWQDDNCFEVELVDSDLNDDGIVNLIDFAILAGNWGTGAVDYDDISKLAEEWLLRSWLYGL